MTKTEVLINSVVADMRYQAEHNGYYRNSGFCRKSVPLTAKQLEKAVAAGLLVKKVYRQEVSSKAGYQLVDYYFPARA